MRYRQYAIFVIGLLAAVYSAGCSATKVKRVATDTTIDLSGRWNDTDSRLVAQEMIADSLNRPWISEFWGEHNRAPVVIVGPVANRSHEHINTELFTKNLEMSLLNSGKVKFVASQSERPESRSERKAQHEGYTNPETIKAIGKETGADFILIGSVNTAKDEVKGRYAILYQTNLELIDLLNNEKVWIGEKKIKKVVSRSRFSL